MTLIQFFMGWAAIGYFGASMTYLYEGQPWMSLTMLFYFFSIGTVYMAGTN